MLKMIKLGLVALLLPMMAHAQTYPSPTFAKFTNPSTGQFYQNFGANVSRVQDRLFVGDAANNNGTQVASQPDWLTTFQIATGRGGGFMQESTEAVLNGSNSQSTNTLVVGARTLNIVIPGLNAIGITGIGVNNNTSTSAVNAYAGYNEAYRMSGAAGGAYGFELDTVNYASDVVTDPYQQASSETVAMQLAAGAGLSSTGQFPGQAAINIQNNNSTFDIGINIGSTAITGDNGTTGTGTAIALGKGHVVQWFSGAGVKTSGILSTGTTNAAGITQQFLDNQVQWLNASGIPVFSMVGVASGVDGIQALGAISGQNPQLAAIGTDTNISLQLTPKGTGSIVVNGPLSTSGTVSGAGFSAYLASPPAIGGTAAAAGAFTTLSATGTITPSQTAGIVGTTTSNSANAGSDGEYVSNSATAVSLSTTGVATNITSISLTAGDWDVSGTVTFVPAGTTTMSQLNCGTSTTSASYAGLGTISFLTIPFTTGQNQGLIAPMQRISIASTTTVYLVATAVFGTSTITANGFIRARRVR